MRWKVKFQPNIRDTDLIREIIDIEAHRYFVHEIPLQPSIRASIDRINIIRAIRGTTGIEGNLISEERVGEIVSTDFTKEDAKSLDDLEALGAKKVLEFIRSTPPQENAEITQSLVCRLHRLTTEDCRYENNVPGEYRRFNVRAGEYRCPDYEEVPGLMKQFIEFINNINNQVHHPVVKAVLAHFYLVSIHPFGDGNGRTSRGLEAYILYNSGYNLLGFYSLANFFYRERNAYVNELQAARFKYNGDVTEFARFSLKGFVAELADIRKQVLEFYSTLAFRDYLLELHNDGQINTRIYSLLMHLTEIKGTKKIAFFRDRSDRYVAALWKDKADRTLRADYKTMKDLQLIAEEKDHFGPNIGLMQNFVSIKRTY